MAGMVVPWCLIEGREIIEDRAFDCASPDDFSVVFC
jgi:hypothetical protein